MKLQVRWLIPRDLTEVCEIENASFPNPWSREDFQHCRRQPDCIAMVAEHARQIVGFVFYALHPGQLRILDIAVDPSCRRQRVGTTLVERMVSRLAQQGRERVVAETRETNLGAQCFYRSLGFRVADQTSLRYEDTDEACYVMVYQLGQQATPERWSARNRISEYLA